ncbi:22401_t:CDS:1, partial [Racocetra persica]
AEEAFRGNRRYPNDGALYSTPCSQCIQIPLLVLCIQLLFRGILQS